jgi:hypothetical protein
MSILLLDHALFVGRDLLDPQGTSGNYADWMND